MKDVDYNIGTLTQMNFKDFYLKESPIITDTKYEIELNDWYYNTNTGKKIRNNEIKNISKCEDFAFRSLKLMIYLFQHKNIKEYFIINKSTSNICGWLRIMNDNFTNGLWNRPVLCTGLIFKFLLGYLLPKLKTIISDIVVNTDGNNFWIAIIKQGLKHNHEVGVYKNNEFFPLYNIEEFTKYFNETNVSARYYIKE